MNNYLLKVYSSKTKSTKMNFNVKIAYFQHLVDWEHFVIQFQLKM